MRAAHFIFSLNYIPCRQSPHNKGPKKNCIWLGVHFSLSKGGLTSPYDAIMLSDRRPLTGTDIAVRPDDWQVVLAHC
jgi:hypothetical protein